MSSDSRNMMLANVVAPLGLLLVLVATATPFFLMHTPWAIAAYPWVYGAGAIILLVARLFVTHQTADDRLKRLYRLEKWSPILFIAALAILLYNQYYDPTHTTLRDWLAFTMAGAALQVFTGFAIPARMKKSNAQ